MEASDLVLDAASTEKTLSSCSECRRRKARCDRSTPCNNCARYGRDCSYETISRTPLTRKHLTNVEKELARTKALLRRYEKTKLPDHNGSAQIESSGNTGEQNELHRDTEQQFDDHEVQDWNSLNVNSEGDALRAGPLSDLRASSHQPSSVPQLAAKSSSASMPAPNHTSTTIGGERPPSPAFSLETSPNNAEFDWDERGHKANQHFIDGMATLTNRSSRGYMGIASGAALLRLADNTVDTALEAEHDPSENLQETPPLPRVIFTFSQLEPFIEAYFQTYHVSYPIVHEATFRAQFMEVVPRPRGSAWQVLLYIVAALGAFSSSSTASEFDLALYDAAKSRMSIDMLETGNLTLVQALTLMSNYVQKRNKPNSGYNYLGLAKRMAMGIGLHKEFPAWHSMPMRLEMRRRVYWALYIFDVGASITFSRPLDWPHEGIEIQLPLNVADSDITSNTSRFPAEAQEVTLYSHIRCQSQFHLATSGIYSTLLSREFPSAEKMLQEDNNHLVSWLRKMPKYFQESALVPSRYHLCHCILQWRWRNFRILMYRPFLMRKFLTKRRSSTLPSSPAEDSAIQRCLEAASESIQLITQYWATSTQNVLACWYSLYFLFQSTLIPVVCLRNEPHSSSAGEWRNQIAVALETISDMTRLNSAATRCYAVIIKLCGKYLGQDMSQWESPTTESPLTQLNALNSFMWPMTDTEFPNTYDFGFVESVPFDFVNQFAM